MMKFLKSVGVAAALLFAPLAASAATVTVVDGGSYDVNAGNVYDFQQTFNPGDAAHVLTFTFFNSGPGAQMTALTFATVNQGTASFTGGVEAIFGTDSFTVAEGDTVGFTLETIIAGFSSVTLTLDYGAVFATGPGGFGTADIDFSVAAVPLPAGGLLLISGLAGAAALRRRKKAA